MLNVYQQGYVVCKLFFLIFFVFNCVYHIHRKKKSSYIKLPVKWRNSMKSLINIRKDDNKCFLWCHFRYLNPLKIYPERIKKADKNMINDLEYESIEFLYLKKILARLNKKVILALMCFVMKMIWFILFVYQIKNLRILWIYCW